MRNLILSYALNVSCECFGANTRLFNDETKGVSSLSKVASTVGNLSVAKNKKNKNRKIDVHKLFEPSETQLANTELNLKSVGLCDAIKKKSASVGKKEVIEKESFLNKFI